METQGLPDLRGLTRLELADALAALGEKPAHAEAVFLAVHRGKTAAGGALWNVPPRVCAALDKAFSLPPLPGPERVQLSKDGTKKLLFRFPGGAPAECVVLPAKDRVAACLSSQSGCSCGCTFCATGALGLKRSLTPVEIIAQFEACLKEAGTLNSLVFMGMGEPFLNWENVKRAILILSDSRGRHFPQAKMTVSTVGIIPVIEELAASDLRVRLAISVVAADEEQRARMAPMEKKYPLRRVLEAVRAYCAARKALVMFEYILFPGLNDRPADSALLARLIGDIPCRVNLIPYNPPGAHGGESPRVKEFQLELIRAGVRTYLRPEKGADIAAACGQLAAGA
ncbi:MAG: 23S rRNA (adenine(2503)-C(2))-methyltransferase RlmN [Elusimicrobiales bacterium]|nr:23S rRNA (adenine(2503)-C(2))-methyltransferase RlmN [Elusimicrobiales bacterium]